jgi:hypothetical protein
VIAAPDGRLAVAPFENPALASGGTGDVLSGTIGSLLAQHLAPYDAARLGVYLHGLAGDSVRDRLGESGLLASDLPEPIAMARKRLAAIAERARAAAASASVSCRATPPRPRRPRRPRRSRPPSAVPATPDAAPVAPAQRRSRQLTGPGDSPPIEARLAAAASRLSAAPPGSRSTSRR